MFAFGDDLAVYIRFSHSAFNRFTSGASFSPYRRSKPQRPPAILW
jgi:hypothetical protein